MVVLAISFSGCVRADRKYTRQLVQKSVKKELRRLKKDLKREISAELRREFVVARAREGNQLKDEAAPLSTTLKRRRKAEAKRGRLPTERHHQAVRSKGLAVGNVKGRMLRAGVGLAQCRVRLVQLTSSGSILKTYIAGEEFETITDEDGYYRFKALPSGNYKIKWELPGDKGWIRRLKDRPDVIVKEGRTSLPKPIETHKRLLPR
jgi:hypothetical protein